MPRIVTLERELRRCRREVYLHLQLHDAAWLQTVERRRARALNLGLLHLTTLETGTHGEVTGRAFARFRAWLTAISCAAHAAVLMQVQLVGGRHIT